ncbi:MAG: SRPBCC domain-containing protein [Anaerolineales bacterium]|jgi:uncharacterized protein YndB with AHSA1/START domain
MKDSQISGRTIPAVKKVVSISLPVEAAFKLFTEEMASWWPLKSHSVGDEHTDTCVFEGHAGGRIYEIQDDGTQADWGRVLAWEPPRRVIFSWYPGRKEDTAQKVEVTFAAEEGGTRVQLVHTGWELLGERATELREGYVSGWDFVLGQFVGHAVSLS